MASWLVVELGRVRTVGAPDPLETEQSKTSPGLSSQIALRHGASTLACGADRRMLRPYFDLLGSWTHLLE